MTIKAFSEKYNIPYRLAVLASKPVEHKATLERDVDYLEEDLYKSLEKILIHRIHEADLKALQIRNQHREVRSIANRSGLLTRKV